MFYTQFYTQHATVRASDTELTIEIGEFIVERRTSTVAVTVTRCGRMLLLLLQLEPLSETAHGCFLVRIGRHGNGLKQDGILPEHAFTRNDRGDKYTQVLHFNEVTK